MASRRMLPTMALIVLSAICSARESKTPKVSIEAENQPVREIVASLSQATGVTVLATAAAADTPATVELTDAELESAVRAVAEAIGGSWLRTYIIELAPQETQDQPEDVLMRLQLAWRDFMLSCTDEELNTFRERALAAIGGPPTLPPPTPGGGMMFDAVEMLQGPFHVEQISLKLNGVEVREALKQFTLLSGYMPLVSPEVQGQVTLDVTNAELADVLEAICAPIGAQWRPLYLIGKAREITPEQIEQGFMAMLQRGAEEFWKLPPDRRQEIIRRITDRLSNIPPETRSAIAGAPWASRIMGRVMQFVLNLTPEQRREIAPLLQGFARLMAP